MKRKKEKKTILPFIFAVALMVVAVYTTSLLYRAHGEPFLKKTEQHEKR